MTNAENMIGGTSAGSGVVVADSTTSNVTPGKLAKARANRKAEKAEAKRAYAARGTTYWARRVVLGTDGNPVGRGKPAKGATANRTVVYVPVGMEYDVKVHGTGVKYNSHSHRATHRRIAKDSVQYTFDNGVEPTKGKVSAKSKVKAKAKTVSASGGKKKVGAKVSGTVPTQPVLSEPVSVPV
jgi:hypothetical protein